MLRNATRHANLLGAAVAKHLGRTDIHPTWTETLQSGAFAVSGIAWTTIARKAKQWGIIEPLVVATQRTSNTLQPSAWQSDKSETLDGYKHSNTGYHVPFAKIMPQILQTT